MRWKVSPEHPVYYQTVLDVTQTTDFTFSTAETPEVVITRETASQFFDLFGKKPSYALLRHAGENVVDEKITQSLEASGVDAEKLEALKTDLGMVVTYDLYERLVATSRSYKKKGDMLTSMRVQYYGRGTFSINQGRWVAYNAVFTLESMGMMAAKMKGVYGLMPVDDVPEVFKQD